MSKKNITLFAVLTVLGISIFYGVPVKQPPTVEAPSEIAEDVDAPEKELMAPVEDSVSIDLSSAETEDGEPFDQLKYIDENLIITFTNSNCPYCDDQALAYKELEDEFDFKHFYIPTKETSIATSNVLDAIGIEDYEFIIDRGEVLKDHLSINSVPTSLVKKKGEDSFTIVRDVLKKEAEDEEDTLLKDYID